MKKILLTLFGFLSLNSFSQAITVSSNSHTPNQLVNALVPNACLVQISNVSTSTGTNFGSVNGIGYYQNTNGSFPVTSGGVLLTTGQAVLSPGPNTSVLNGGSNSATWGGDAGLEAALASAGITITSKNATVLEFDFVPSSSNFGFDFLFASDEYGAFQCESNDAFVVLVTQGATTQNVAVIPSTSTPVTVSTIRNILFNSNCPSANPSFFGVFNGGGNAATSPTNYNGQTVLMHASATLTPNVPCHIRFVIADDGGTDGTDGDFDSAVFIPAGSLNLGQKLFTQDFTIANGNALCFGQIYTLNTNLDEATYDFQWFRNGNPIAGQSGPSFVVTQEGEYSVTLTRPDLGCTTTQSIIIEYRPEILPGAPQNLIKCDNGSGSYTYDLSQNTPLLKQGLDPAATVTYHISQINAENSASPLPLTYNSPAGFTIWARVQLPNGCYAVRSFQLLTSPAPLATTPPNLTLCESAQASNSAIFDLTQQNATVLNGQDPAQNQVLYFTSMGAATAGTPAIETPESFTGTTQTIYIRVQKSFDPTCFSIAQFDLIVKPLPVLPASYVVNACNSYVLPAVAGADYFTGNGGTGTMIAAGTTITTSQILYLYAQSGGTPDCSNQSQVTVNIITTATAPSNVVACENYTLPALTSGEYRDAPAGGGSVIPAGTVITGTQTIYFFIPEAASCTQNNNFTVTITNTPVVTDPADVTSCGPYILPTLPNGEKYFTGPNGTGTQLANGASITTSQTIYIYTSNPTNPTCTAESSFNVTVHLVDVDDRPDVTQCFLYTLPPLAVGNYYTAPGGGGTMIPFQTQITSTQTIYIYAQSPTNPSCFDEESFQVNINTTPTIPFRPNVTACSSYTLPPVANAQYYTGPQGTGTLLPAGSVITASQTIYVFNQSNTSPNCTRQRSFTVTIIDLAAENPGTQTACGSYVLPPLTIGKYYTGPNGTGTMMEPGTNYTTPGTNTIYIYATSSTTPTCSVQDSFEVTIVPRPNIPVIPDVVACMSYQLPSLPVGNYFTGPGGTGTMFLPGDVITSTQSLYVYAETSPPMTPACTREREFTITIINTSIAPPSVTACGFYTLPVLSIGEYRTAPNGGGTVIPAETDITSTQTIWVYSPVASGANCTDDDNFTVTINPALLADDPADVRSCVNYQLPVLAHGNYYTGPGGTGTMLSAGDIITSNQTIYIYNSATGVNCTAENSFTVEILDITVTDLPDVLVCAAEGYQLPVLTVGNYFTAPNGGGTMLNAGDIITTDQTIYIYAATTTPPVCSDQEQFTVTIKPAPVIDNPGNVGSCGNYVLPALVNGDYYTGPGGTGTHLFAGQVISETTQLYIFAETGGVPNCTAENVFNVIINPAAPEDVVVCDSYQLPVLAIGNYFTGPAGTGTPKFAGDIITTSQQMYVWVNLGTTPNCTDNNSFTITINPSPVLDAVDPVITRCDRYELPALTVGDYYTQPAGQGTLLPAGTFITSSQTIYRYAESGTTPNCITEDSFNVVINQTPLVDARSNIAFCGPYTLDELIVGTYYLQPGGPSPTNPPLPDNYVVTSTQTVYIYGETGTTPNCFNENSFLVEIFNITADDPADVTACDSYQLPALTVGKYYANPGGPNLLDPTVNPEIPAGTFITNPGVNTLYVYAETGGRVNCTDENSFTVTIYQTPVVDDSQTNIAQCTPFTLPALAAGTPGAYYTGPGGTGATMAAGTVISAPTMVYVYAASDPAGACFDEHSFFADVNIVDVTAPNDITICDQYILPVLASGDYYTAPNGGGSMLNAGDAITSTQTLYVYDEAGSTVVCPDQDDFTVTIITAPQINIPAPLIECGLDDAGHAIFNLQPALDFALGGQADMDVRVYETIEDADFDVLVNQIPNVTNYSNIVAYDQTLYIRVFSTVSDCYSIVPFQLHVNDRPVATTPQPLEVCDGEDNNGFALFNLTLVKSEVLGTLSPFQFTVRYYDTQANAEAGTATGEITGPVAYNSNTATVYIRVQNNTTDCYDIVPLELIVNPLPTANHPDPISKCDENNPGDGQEEFDLTIRAADITGGDTGTVLTYYHTFAQAQAGNPADAIANVTAYVNGPTVETLFVRVTDEVTGCYRIVLQDVRVQPLPQITMPAIEDVTVCDADADGFAVFNLQGLLDDMLNGATDIQITMHHTPEDAEDGINEITNLVNYVNSNPLQETIYVRAVNTDTGCVSFNNSFTLRVNLAPQLPDLDDIAVCDTNSTLPAQTVVDLTQQDADIIAAIGTGYTIYYFASATAAQDGAPRITDPAAYLGADGEEIWVRATDSDGCFGITSFFLEISTPLLLATPAPLTQCDNDTVAGNGLIFDLTAKDNEILGPFGVGQGYTLAYYTRNNGTPVNSNPVINLAGFTLIGTPAAYNFTGVVQTLYVVVTSPAPASCRSFTTLTIRILPLPTPDTTPDTLEQCDDDTDGFAEFNLRDAEADIRNNDTTTIVTYYTTEAAAQAGVAGTEIGDPEHHTAATGTVWVRVAANTNNPADPTCYVVVELPLVVNPLPVLGNPATGVIDPFPYCEVNTSGYHTFILNQHVPRILVGQDPAGYTVKFYLTQANADAGTPALPNQYTNTTQYAQTIWVRVENNDTGCVATGSFQLLVEEGAVATEPDNTPFQICDTQGDNDGFATFDLTQAAADVLGTQNPAQYAISYHTSEADAIAGDSPIANPAAYVNDSAEADTVWVRVTNTSTVSQCSAIATIDIIVEPLPEPVIDADGNTLCYGFGNTAPNAPLQLSIDGLTGTGHTYQWYLNGTAIAGATGATYDAVQEGAYTVQVNGPAPRSCPSDMSAVFTVIKSGVASIPAGTQGYSITGAFSDNQTITVNIQGYGNYEYQLDNGEFQDSNVFTNIPFSSYTHTITVRDKNVNSCGDLVIRDVMFIDYPRYFTPNGDGYHDRWNITGLGNDPAGTKIYIFDRYGKLIKQISSAGDGWDGTMNSYPLPADDYWFTVTFTEMVPTQETIGGTTVTVPKPVTREFKAHFSLKR